MRQNLITAILGRRNTGKTTYFLQEILPVLLKTDKKVLIYDPANHPKYKMIANIEPNMLKTWRKSSVYKITGKPEEILPLINENVINSYILFEDASKYIKNQMQLPIRNLLYDSKTNNNDLIFMFHGFTAMPPDMIRQIDIITLFKTGDTPEVRKNDIVAEYDAIKKGWDFVMKSKNQYENVSIQVF